MFAKKNEVWRGEEATVLYGIENIDLKDTFECGQAFRYQRTAEDAEYIEYMTVVGDKIIRVGQRRRGELMVYGLTDGEIDSVIVPYFALDTDFNSIRTDILSRTNSEWLKNAAESAKGIVILRQDPWETVFSFIISQNNNIPRIRKIIQALAAEYGENLAVRCGMSKCPLGRIEGTPCDEKCRGCGICYSFPHPEEIAKRPEGMLPSHPGFRYRYLLDAAERVVGGLTDLCDIRRKGSYEHTVTELKKITGVGDKVASCAALFGFGNLEAFPIDVWMKRAIDNYFDGDLDYVSLGEYRGVAQQYIFHYIRNLEGAE